MIARLGALALLASGLIHLEEYALQHYDAIPTIGPLFLLDFLAAALIAGGLAWRPGRAAAAVGVAVAAGSLAALLISERTPLFGFTESGYRPAIVAAIATEVAAIVLLGVALGTLPRKSRGNTALTT
jgi:hypothetical protein